MPQAQRMVKKTATSNDPLTYRTRIRSNRTTNRARRRPSLLLLLPAELRNQIYHYVLVSDSDARARIDLSHLVQPPLTATCRQIRFEALAIFFSANKFELHISSDRVTLNGVRPLISPSTTAWIKAVPEKAIRFRDVEITRENSKIDAFLFESDDASNDVVLSVRTRKSWSTYFWERYGARELDDVKANRIQSYLDRIVNVRGLGSLGLRFGDVVKTARMLART